MKATKAQAAAHAFLNDLSCPNLQSPVTMETRVGASLEGMRK